MLDLIRPILINIIRKDCHIYNMSDIINPCILLTIPYLINLLSGTDNLDDILLKP